MGHPLPPGQLPLSGELAWFLVAIPDDPILRQAALAAYTNLGKYWVWGADAIEWDKSSEVAQLFNEAIAETLRAWEMSLLDQLVANTDNVETLLQLLIDRPCCDYPAIDYIPGGDTVVGVDDTTESTSTTDRDTDTYPAGMTEGQFDTFLCEAAERYVDQLLNWPTKMLGAGQIGMTALLSALILSVAGAFISIGLTAVSIISLSALITWVTRIQAIGELILAGSEDEPSFIETALATRRSDLICAIYCGPTADAAAATVRAIIDEELSPAWADVMGWWPYESTLARVYNYQVDAGGFGGGGGFDCSLCDCDPTPETANFELGEFWVAPVAGVTITQLSPHKVRYQYSNATPVRIQAVARAGMQTKLCATAPSGTLATEIRFSGSWTRGDSIPSYDSKKAATAVTACPYNRQTGGTSIVTGTFLPGAIDITISNSQSTSATYPTYVQTALLDNYATSVDITIELVSMVQT